MTRTSFSRIAIAIGAALAMLLGSMSLSSEPVDAQPLCTGFVQVGAEADLADAITCFNETGIDTTIEFTADITLAASLPVIDEQTGAELELLGEGFTLDGGGIASIVLHIEAGVVSIDALGITGGGSGILNDGTLTVTKSLIHANDLAGIFGGGGGEIVNSTLYENGTFGLNAANQLVTVISTTSVGNQFGLDGNVTVENSLIADNTIDCGMGVVAVSGNAFGTECNGEAETEDLLGTFGPLAANPCGPTTTQCLDTVALLAGSPAINAPGPCSVTEDQRGVSRVGMPCDAGAYEKINGAPVGVEDSYTVPEDVGGVALPAIGVLANDTDPDGNPLIATLLTTTANGTITLNPDGSFDYQPDPDFAGVDTFTYEANDGTAVSDPTTVTITVTEVNDAPIVVNDAETVNINSVDNVVDVLDNDSDLEDDELTLSQIRSAPNTGGLADTGSQGGTAVIVDNEAVYTPPAGFQGTETFWYKASDGTDESAWAKVTMTVGQPLCNGEIVTVYIAAGDSPTNGDDVILGSPNADAIDGLAGDDVICGEGGADTIDGGTGDDTIFGGDAADTIDGGLGNDMIFGEKGTDTIDGGVGDDRIEGGNDADTIDGGLGADAILGGQGGDTIDGGDGDDRIFGQRGDDTIFGGTGDDLLVGKKGNDEIFGGPGEDTVKGGEDDDTVEGGSGDDPVINGGAGVDIMRGGEGNDVLRGNPGNDTMFGGAGDDDMKGGLDDDELHGGEGADTMFGKQGNDDLFGDAGDDFLWGSKGADDLDGGAGTDECRGGPGTDTTTACEGP